MRPGKQSSLKHGWPFVVVVRRGDEYENAAAKMRKEAREVALAKRQPASVKGKGKGKGKGRSGSHPCCPLVHLVSQWAPG